MIHQRRKKRRIVREHSTGLVGAVHAWGEADDHQSRVRIAPAGNGFAAMIRPLRVGIAKVLHEAGTKTTGRDTSGQLSEADMGGDVVIHGNGIKQRPVGPVTGFRPLPRNAT